MPSRFAPRHDSSGFPYQLKDKGTVRRLTSITACHGGLEQQVGAITRALEGGQHWTIEHSPGTEMDSQRVHIAAVDS